MKSKLLLAFASFFFILVSLKADNKNVLIVDPNFKSILSLPISERIDSITTYFEKSNMLPPQKISILKKQLDLLENDNPIYSSKIKLNLAYQYIELSQYDESKNTCLEIISLLSVQKDSGIESQGLVGKAYQFLTSIYFKTEDWINLEATSERSIDFLETTKDTTALVNSIYLYGSAFLMQNKFEEAISQFDIVRMFPLNNESINLDNEYSVALALIGLDRPKEAGLIFDSLIVRMIRSEHPKYSNAILTYADLLDSLKEYKDAEIYYLKAHTYAIENKRWNDLKLISSKIASLHEKNNKLDKALEYRKILEVYADSLRAAQSAATLVKTNGEFESFRRENMLMKAKYEQMLAEADSKLISNRKFINFFLLLSILIFGLICYFMVRKVNNIIAKNVSELKETKEKLFHTVSHEIKEPVSLSQSYIKKLKEEDLPNNVEDLINSTDKSLNGLIGHINTLLDWNKVESNSAELNLTKNSYPEILEEVFESTKSKFKEKNIIWLSDVIPEKLICELDFEYLNKVVSILLTNAATIVSHGAIISMTSRIESDNQLKIDIKDNGPGIPLEKVDNVFNWEYSKESFSNKKSNAFEINMSLAKQYVKLMNGKLDFVNDINLGTHFSLLLPFTFVKEKQLVSQLSKVLIKPRKRPSVLLKQDDNRANILLIEDHIEFSNFVSDTLSDHFNISIAHDPDIGLAISYKEIPDLIICDLISTNKNNLEIYKKLRYHILTDHIPMIVFITKEEDKEAYNDIFRDNDAFLKKPFDGEYLTETVNKILNNKSKIDLSKKLNELEEGRKLSSFEELLLVVLEKNYHKADFNADQFASQIKMTKGQMLKKMKSMFDDNASKLLTDYRLLKSQELLDDGIYSIDDIAKKCGFRNSEYFVTVFKDHFKIDPNDKIK